MGELSQFLSERRSVCWMGFLITSSVIFDWKLSIVFKHSSKLSIHKRKLHIVLPPHRIASHSIFVNVWNTCRKWKTTCRMSPPKICNNESAWESSRFVFILNWLYLRLIFVLSLLGNWLVLVWAWSNTTVMEIFGMSNRFACHQYLPLPVRPPALRRSEANLYSLINLTINKQIPNSFNYFGKGKQSPQMPDIYVIKLNSLKIFTEQRASCWLMACFKFHFNRIIRYGFHLHTKVNVYPDNW